jgi:hypothetical protein
MRAAGEGDGLPGLLWYHTIHDEGGDLKIDNWCITLLSPHDDPSTNDCFTGRGTKVFNLLMWIRPDLNWCVFAVEVNTAILCWGSEGHPQGAGGRGGMKVKVTRDHNAEP